MMTMIIPGVYSENDIIINTNMLYKISNTDIFYIKS